MYYAITHLTIYEYSAPVNDSVMEIRKQPRSDGEQRCIRFNLEVTPKARVFSYRDYQGNTIHTFNIPAAHEHLALKAEAVVEVKEPAPLPDFLADSAWTAIDAQTENDRDFYDWLQPGEYARVTPMLMEFAEEIDWRRRADPLSLLRELNAAIYQSFDYNQNVTNVDSPIDHALESRSGVCQDFTHIMLALTRSVGIPSRYVSGYLFHRQDENDRSDTDASHAWVECWLPRLGWIGFDPTNNLIVSDRHIRVSVARDYAHASPSRGVFMGAADTTLGVRVKVDYLDDLPVEEAPLAPEIVLPQYSYYHQQQAQQQQ